MSYEGYVQGICENGHLTHFQEPYIWGDSKPHACEVCEASIAWHNPVDQTNCDDFGIIPQSEFDKLLVEAEIVETCSLGHQHVTKQAVYRIPTDNELKRYYLDGDSNLKEIPSPCP